MRGSSYIARHRCVKSPLDDIRKAKKKIEEIAPGPPKKTLYDGTVSQVSIAPFYDRTGLIHKTLGTLGKAPDKVIAQVSQNSYWHHRAFEWTFSKEDRDNIDIST